MGNTEIVSSNDGCQIAYDISGKGPAILLLHGAGQTRQAWRTAGYVDRLQVNFTVISMDIRGTGESSVYDSVSDYAIEKITSDSLAIADACRAERFSVWGFSLGGMIARYLAASTERATSLILTGTSLQSHIDVHFREFTNAFAQKWEPFLALQQSGLPIPSDAQIALASGVPARLAFFRAICDWPEFPLHTRTCPTLLFTGSEDKPVSTWLRENQDQLESLRVTSKVLEGMDHFQSFAAIDQTMPHAVKFLQRQFSPS
jgi:pimeloyl-ACP methyl ester carboxylesterase